MTSTLLPILPFPLHDILSASIPTPRPTPYFSIHYPLLLFPLPDQLLTSLFITLYFYFHPTTHSLLLYSLHSHSMTHSVLLTSLDALLSSLHLCDSLHLPIMY